MTDNEIKKALYECQRNFDCYTCPMNIGDVCMGLGQLCCETEDLINRLETENKQLKIDVDLAKFEKYKADFIDCKTEIIKEFAERVKTAFYYEFEELIPSIMADKIDSLVQEMVGE